MDTSSDQGSSPSILHEDEFNASVAGLLADYLEEAGGVSAGVLVCRDDRLVAGATVGRRRHNAAARTTLADRWHIGSVTKSVTATMLASLVERGLLGWDTTIAEVFGADRGRFPAWDGVTLQQLLTHTSGAPANLPLTDNLKRPAPGKARIAARERAVFRVMRKPPLSFPGLMYRYSNAGYAIAGALAERLTGRPWEDLVLETVAVPLGLAGAGFGSPPSRRRRPSEPWGHGRLWRWRFAVGHDNSPLIGPAGTLHLTLGDLVAYGNDHLNGLAGAGRLLQPDSYRRLHRPLLADYACGWLVQTGLGGMPDAVHWHDGSNTLWYALLALIPARRLVVALAFNDGFALQRKQALAFELARRLPD